MSYKVARSKRARPRGGGTLQPAARTAWGNVASGWPCQKHEGGYPGSDFNHSSGCRDTLIVGDERPWGSAHRRVRLLRGQPRG